MPCICYAPHRFSPNAMALINSVNDIVSDYQRDGYRLTLRQLYYQFVARGLLPNAVQSYKRLGAMVSDARLAGLVDWEMIEDRTRGTVVPPTWDGPADIIGSAAKQYQIDRWRDQPCRPEVWCEKEALAGVLEGTCGDLGVPHLSCRGYASLSEMWASAQRLRRAEAAGQKTIVFHLGDHDPSGLDMTRDVRERLRLLGSRAGVRRLALNINQIRKYSPPPNPAKVTDARFAAYRKKYGTNSWELDALEPSVLQALVRKAVESLRDEELWKAAVQREERERARIRAAAERWEEIESLLGA